MKNEREREEIIKTINELLEQTYDSVLDEILSYLQKIDEIDDEEDLKAIEEARVDITINGTVSWNEIQNEINKHVA